MLCTICLIHHAKTSLNQVQWCDLILSWIVFYTYYTAWLPSNWSGLWKGLDRQTHRKKSIWWKHQVHKGYQKSCSQWKQCYQSPLEDLNSIGQQFISNSHCIAALPGELIFFEMHPSFRHPFLAIELKKASLVFNYCQSGWNHVINRCWELCDSIPDHKSFPSCFSLHCQIFQHDLWNCCVGWD